MKPRIEIHPANDIAPEQREEIEEWWRCGVNMEKFNLLKDFALRAVSPDWVKTQKFWQFLQRWEWFQHQFGHIPYQRTTPDWCVLAYVEDTLIGHLGIIERRVVAVDGQPTQLSGICGVITHPAWRGRGIASAMLEQAVAFIRNELATEFCLLLCQKGTAPLYARFGWQCVEGPTTFQQPAGKMTHARLTMVLSCGGKEWPIGSIDLCGLPW